MNSNLRVAIVHDWLTAMGGAEYTLMQILKLYPQADIYTIVDTLPLRERQWLDGHRIHTSPLQKIPFLTKRYRQMIWMMPFWIEQFDLEHYDLIISDSHAVAKGVIIHPHQKHIAYIHSPMRYAWDLQYRYDDLGVLGKSIRRFMIHRWLHKFRIWDALSSMRPHMLLANSGFIQKRIRNAWGRDADVVYPPVDVEGAPFVSEKEDYYITVSRLVPYKRVDLIIETFRSMPDKRLIVIGDGPMYRQIVHNAPTNISVEGYLGREEMLHKLSHAKAFIFMPKEDFGIAPLEAQACGTPVIAYGHGGAAETVRGMDQENPTGVFVDEQSIESLKRSIGLFEANREKFSAEKCRDWAMKFSEKRFRDEFLNSIEVMMKDRS